MTEDFPTISALRAALDSRELSAVELMSQILTRVEANSLNCFISVFNEQAMDQARLADATIASGQQTALTGIPIAHKDIFLTQGHRTSCGSKILDNFIAPYDATVTEKLAAAGSVCLGKTNMDEFAMGSSNENSFYGAVKNPWNKACVPGGSSGGSAAAIAAGLVPAATGTDTGGSIRQPAAFCGVSGIKPTYGRVSRYGMVAFASSLDQAGVFAHTAQDLGVVLNAMSGHDPRDSTSAREDTHGLSSFAETPQALSRPIRIGLPKEYFSLLNNAALENIYQDVRRVFEQQNIEFVEVSLPHTSAAVPTYYVVAGAEASTNLSRFDGVRYGHRCENPQDLEDLYTRSRTEGFGAEVKRRILTGTYTLSVGYYDAYYVKAQKVRRLIAEDFTRAFNEVDLLLTPTTPSAAFRLGEMSKDPVQMYQQDVFTVPASLAGLPAMSLPCGFTEPGNNSEPPMPLGCQLLAPHFSEQLLLETALLYQQNSDWHEQHPDLIAQGGE